MEQLLSLAVLALLLAAVWTFLVIQRYMNDPRRRELNEQWFAAYEAHVRLCYANSEQVWRVGDLKQHFNRAPD